ncbi:MAG TPA: DNA primase [bacterium]|nr:DNA primase [bacterium]
MAGRSREATDEIRRRIGILDVVSAHVTLKRSGRRYTGLCPFHSEKTPSFTVNPELGFFYCFGCHAGGDVFDFVMRLEGVPFPVALTELAGRAGVPLPQTPEDERLGGERERLLRVVAEAAAFFRSQLAGPDGLTARRYLADRGVDAAAAETFRLGYAPAGWDGLLRALRGRGFDAAAAEQAGLAVARSGAGGTGHYDALRHRLIFPIHDLQGRPVAFGGRALDEATPKYLNTRETALFVKGRTLYALDAARAAIRAAGEAVVVEGYMDALTCHQFGITNAVASLGTALTQDQALLLKRFAARAVLVYDADASGMDAAERGLGIFEQVELPVRVAVLPGRADPDELLRARGAEAFRRTLAEAQSVFDYRFAMAASRHDGSTVEGKVGIVDEVSQLIIIAPNPVRQSEYVRQLAERLAVREDAVRGQIRRLAKGREESRTPAAAGQAGRAVLGSQAPPEAEGRVGAETLLLHLLVADASVRVGIRGLLDARTFREPARHALAEALLDPEAEGIDPGRLRERLRDEAAISLLSRFLIEEPPVRGDARRIAEGCVRTLRLADLEERIDRLVEAHAEAVRGRDDGRRDRLAVELLEAGREKERIRELKVSV